MSQNNNSNNSETIAAIIVCIVIGLFIFMGYLSCSESGGSRRDVTHDPNGFMGYSDSFWEWAAKQ